jgi:hypothetical protein
MTAAIETDELTKDYKVGFGGRGPTGLDRLTLAVEPQRGVRLRAQRRWQDHDTEAATQLVVPDLCRAAILAPSDLECGGGSVFPENPYFTTT